jgi:O-antigen/teichoic acid export membrane protein
LAPATAVYDGIYRWLRQFKKLSLITTLVMLFSIIYIYLLVYFYGLIGALAAQSLFYLVLLCALGWWYRDWKFWIDQNLIIEVGKYGVLIGIANAWYFLYTKIDVLILGQFWLIKEIAYYEIVDKILMITTLFSTILATVIAPNTTILVVQGKTSRVKNKFIKQLWILLWLGILISLLYYFLFPWIFNYFLMQYDTILLMQLFGLLLIVFPIRFYSDFMNVWYITPSGNVSILAYSTMWVWILNVILNLIFIRYFGFLWIIYATMIVQLIFAIVNTFWFFMRMKNIK